MELQWPIEGAAAAIEFDEFVVADLAGGEALAHRPFDGAGAGALALPPAVQHRPARQHDRRDVDGRRRHDRGRRGLVAAGGEHDAVDRIAVQHLDQAEIGEVAIERRGRPLAGLLDRMHREFERDAAGRADAVAHALGQLQMVAVAGGEVGAGLRDADDRLAAHDLAAGEAVVEVALEIERGRAGIVGVVEPQLRPEARLCARLAVGLCSLRHRGSLWIGLPTIEIRPNGTAIYKVGVRPSAGGCPSICGRTLVASQPSRVSLHTSDRVSPDG